MPELQPCGTFAAYVRHRRKGTPVCRPCYAAHAAYERDWNAQRTARRRQEAAIRELVHVLACALGVGRDVA